MTKEKTFENPAFQDGAEFVMQIRVRVVGRVQKARKTEMFYFITARFIDLIRSQIGPRQVISVPYVLMTGHTFKGEPDATTPVDIEILPGNQQDAVLNLFR